MELKIADGTLYEAHGWGHLIVPKGVKCIASQACRDEKFHTVTLPDGLAGISPYAFFGCRYLRHITIPAGVTTIDEFAFGNCESLRIVSIPPTVTNIHPNAFHCFEPDDRPLWDKTTFTVCGQRGSAAENWSKGRELCKFSENGERNGCLDIGGMQYSKPDLTPDWEGRIVFFRRTEDDFDPEQYEWGIGADFCPYKTIRIFPDESAYAIAYPAEDLYYHTVIPPAELYEAIEAAAAIFRWNSFPEWAETYDRLRQDAEKLLEERAFRPRDAASVTEIREAERETIARGTCDTELMRRAALGIYMAYDGWNCRRSAVICGGGDNGGIGYALAEILHDHGHPLRVIRVSDKFSDAGRFFYDRCAAKGIYMPTLEEGGLDFIYIDNYVDCMIGTGLRGTLREPIRSVIRELNERRRSLKHMFVISADINSGLDGDTGEGELAVESNLTVSIGAFKKGLFRGRAKEIIGKVMNADIGIVFPSPS